MYDAEVNYYTTCDVLYYNIDYSVQCSDGCSADTWSASRLNRSGEARVRDDDDSRRTTPADGNRKPGGGGR